MATRGFQETILLDDERLFQSGVQRRSTVAVTDDAEVGIFGRLHAARSIEIDLPGLERVVELAKANRTPQSWTIDGDAFVSFSGGMRPIVHHGDLHVRGSLLVDEDAWLICTGNLVVDGIFSDHLRSSLAVGGNLIARRIVTTGDIHVLGSVEAAEVMLARDEAAESSALDIGGGVRSPLVLHHLREICARSVVADENVDLANPARVRELYARFSEDAFAATGEIDAERCDRLLRCGLSVFR